MSVDASAAALGVPSSRNLEIFELIESGERSLRAVAAQFGVSPGRVQQIVQQVRRWLGRWCDVEERMSRKQLLLRALYLFDERMKRLARAAFEAWEASKRDQSVVKLRDGGRQETTRTSSGDPRHLTVLLKIEKVRLEAAVAIYEELPRFEDDKPPEIDLRAPQLTPYAPDQPLDDAPVETVADEDVLSEGEVESSEELAGEEDAETVQENIAVVPPMRAVDLKLNRKQRRKRQALLRKLKRGR